MKKIALFKSLFLGIMVAAIPVVNQAQSWQEMSPMIYPRTGAAGCVLDGKIYVIGGVLRVGNTNSLTDQVLVYDPVTDTWDETAASLPFPFTAATASAVNGKVYVFGGDPNLETDTVPVALNSVLEYDPVMNTWTQKADMPTARYGAGSAVVGEKIFVIGGKMSGSRIPSYVHANEMYDPLTDNWTVRDSGYFFATSFTADTLNSKIYVMGGYSIYGSLRTSQIYNPDTDTWSNNGLMPAPCSGHGSGVIDGKIYLFGGRTGSTPAHTWEFDPAGENPWSDLGAPLSEGNYTSFVSAVTEDESGRACLFAIGGRKFPEYSSAVYKYCFTTTAVKEVNGVSTNGMVTTVSPNPFTSMTTLRYALKESARVWITIYDPSGKEVIFIDEGYRLLGEHQLEINAAALSNGIYFYKINGGRSVGTGKFVKQE